MFQALITSRTLTLCLLALLTLPVAGCGVKPREVDPPADVTTDTFPHVYPPADSDANGRYLPPGYTPNRPASTDTTKAQTQ